MKILCTFPGKYGDLLWALPTVRAISRWVGAPVDLAIAQPFGSICTLIDQQPYIRRCWALARWAVQDTAPISPRVPELGYEGLALEGGYDAVLHLGYRDWPLPDLVRHTLETANRAALDRGYAPGDLTEAALGLAEPWIQVDYPAPPEAPPGDALFQSAWCCGFTDEHLELKVGVWTLLRDRADLPRHAQLVGHNPRWVAEYEHAAAMTWLTAARWIGRTGAVLGDCSALHVLAVAMGKPVVLMEPNPMRHNAVFYPLGDRGPQVTLVRGTDGQPTFDARHVADTLTRVLESR